MKVLHYIAWASGIIAIILILLGFLRLLFNVDLFGANTLIHYYDIASTFLLLAIACLLYKKPE